MDYPVILSKVEYLGCKRVEARRELWRSDLRSCAIAPVMFLIEANFADKVKRSYIGPCSLNRFSDVL